VDAGGEAVAGGGEEGVEGGIVKGSVSVFGD